jgi:octaheme c-type cytochrome (tetrathionate reductase family)
MTMLRSPGFVLAAVIAVSLTLVALLVQLQEAPASRTDDPRAAMARPAAHVDHATFFDGEFATGPEVTAACLQCHAEEGEDVLHSAHWTWAGDHTVRDGEDIAIGKKNLLNNFCISVESNWPACTTCHAGYGWRDETFDFDDATNIDCLVCHDQSGQYHKQGGTGGLPADDVDLLEAARSVGRPTRANCGTCHFSGGGGDAVKHGDLDGTMLHPTPEIDVHMGRYDLQCVDCHRTLDHRIAGRSMSVSVSNTQRVLCTDCHAEAPHGDVRLDEHATALACQTCHIPEMAVRAPTKMSWDWSKAGEDRPDADPHEYLKIKGEFVYERNAMPEYYWYDGTATRYLKGDPTVADGVTDLNHPGGDAATAGAKIWPFKVHRGKQVRDANTGRLLIPKTFGEGGYWAEFDWDRALRLGSEKSGLEYTGEYDFAATAMYWPLSHMVAPAERALQCADCHGPNSRLDFPALGYEGDPMQRGARTRQGLLDATEGGAR